MEEQNHIVVLGAGGGGNNAVQRMNSSGMKGLDYVIINTDLQVLKSVKECYPIQIGKKLTRGLGAGGNPDIGRKAAIESQDSILDVIRGHEIAFVAGGMGGGTGTGAAPVIANIAKAEGLLTIGVVTKPFMFEGTFRSKQADRGITVLRENVDSLILINNQNLLVNVDKDLGLNEAFTLADNILKNAIQGITDLITQAGEINVDLEDIRSTLKNSGDAMIGIGYGEGDNRSLNAAQSALNSPLLENASIEGAERLLVNIAGSSKLGLIETSKATEYISSQVQEQAHIIFGTTIDESLDDVVKITVLASGLVN